MMKPLKQAHPTHRDGRLNKNCGSEMEQVNNCPEKTPAESRGCDTVAIAAPAQSRFDCVLPKQEGNAMTAQGTAGSTRQAEPAETDCLRSETRGTAGITATPTPCPKERKTGTRQSNRWYDSEKRSYPSKSSTNQVHKRWPTFDPLLGKQRIPVIGTRQLLEEITEDENILVAVREVRKEPDKAPGIDGMTVPNTCDALLLNRDKRDEIRKALMAGTYRMAPLRCVQIPKGEGKFRTIAIATVRDRIVQKMILQVLQKHLPDEAWHRNSFAYRQGRSVGSAIQAAEEIITSGCTYAISLDLHAFFDNVPHDRLFAKLRKHIADKQVVRLIREFITCTKIIPWQRTGEINRKGCPQGGPLSAYLASTLYLDELDQELERRGLPFVRYADDVTVFCRSRKAARRIKKKTCLFLEDEMECPVNYEKTTISAVSDVEMFHLIRRHGSWHIQEEKFREITSTCRHILQNVEKTLDAELLEHCISETLGRIAYYRRIPNMHRRQLKRLTVMLSNWLRHPVEMIEGSRRYAAIKRWLE